MNRKVFYFYEVSILFFCFILFSCNLYAADSKEYENKNLNNDGQFKNAVTPGNHEIRIKADTCKLLRNPLNGWVLYGSMTASPDFWTKNDNIKVPGLETPVKVSDYANTFYIRTTWAVLNPKENEYGWDTNEKLKWLIDNARQRGMKLAFRVVVDSRDKREDATPAYVRAAGAKGYETKSGKHTVWSPYPDDPVFQRKYEKFIQAFAKKYNDSDVVDFIDGYGLGKWGESHSVLYLDDNHRESVFKWIIDLYAKSFTKVPLAINYHRLVGTGKEWASPDPNSEKLLTYAFDKGYILRHDAFGMTGYYQQWEKDLAAKWRYLRPIVMEGGWVTNQHNISLDPRKYSSIAEVRRGEFIDSKEAHVNMMDFRLKETESWFESCYSLVKEFIAEGGYRLYPDLVSLPENINNGSTIKITHRWNNLGW